MNQSPAVIIDVREPEEFVHSHVEGAHNIPLSSIGANQPVLASLSADTPIVVYCRTGARAGAAVTQLKAMGYTNVTNGVNQATVEQQQ